MKYLLVVLLLLAQLFPASKALISDMKSSAPAPAELTETRTIACVGDSITYGEIPYSSGSHLLDYPTVLGELLGDGWKVYNLGRSGASLTPPGLCYLDCKEHYKALDLGADVYLIMLGSNDSAHGYDFDAALYEQALKDLVELYRKANPDTTIFLMTPPFTRAHYGTFYYSLNPWLIGSDIHEIVERVAEEQHTELLDIYAITLEHVDWIGGDGVHFTQDGYRALGEYIYDEIEPRLKTNQN